MSRAIHPPAYEPLPRSARPADAAAAERVRAVEASASVGLVDRVADGVPGLMFLVSGLVLLAVVAITPAWLTHHEHGWRLTVMQAQAAALREQTQQYENFAQALRDDDPVVLERLAMTHLRLGMAGKSPLWVRPLDQETGDVGAWLSVPQPELGVDLPFYAPPRNRLVRLVTGPGRPALVIVGLMCVIAGVLFNPRSDHARQRVAMRASAREPVAPPVVRRRVGAVVA